MVMVVVVVMNDKLGGYCSVLFNIRFVCFIGCLSFVLFQQQQQIRKGSLLFVGCRGRYCIRSIRYGEQEERGVELNDQEKGGWVSDFQCFQGPFVQVFRE